MGMFDTPGTSPDLDFENQEGYGAEGADNQSGVENEDRNPELEQAGSEQPGDQPPEDDGNGDLILGKYKTQEEFHQAHKALLNRMGQMRNELGQLRQQSTAGQVQPQQQTDESPQWTDEQWKQFDQTFQKEFVKNPGRAVFNLVNDVMQQVVNPIQETIMGQVQSQEQEAAIISELGMMMNAIDDSGQLLFPGVEEMAGQIDNYLERHPYLIDLLANQGMARTQGQIDDTTMGVLEVIYQAAKTEAAVNAGKQAYQNGLQQGQRSAQIKNQARLPSPGAKRSGDASPEEQIVDEIFAHKKSGFFG